MLKKVEKEQKEWRLFVAAVVVVVVVSFLVHVDPCQHLRDELR